MMHDLKISEMFKTCLEESFFPHFEYQNADKSWKNCKQTNMIAGRRTKELCD